MSKSISLNKGCETRNKAILDEFRQEHMERNNSLWVSTKLKALEDTSASIFGYNVDCYIVDTSLVVDNRTDTQNHNGSIMNY